MKTSVILAHPNKKSFNHAIAAAAVEALAQNGNEVFFHDLYEEKFDPVMPITEIDRDGSLPLEIKRHCIEISEANAIIVIHPNWWGQPPAILKGWVDRIIRAGVAYEFLEDDQGNGAPHGLLKAECAIVFNTANTETEREKEVFGDPLETIWKNCVFGICGIRNVYRKTFNVIITSSEIKRKEWLKEVRQTVVDYLHKNTVNYCPDFTPYQNYICT